MDLWSWVNELERRLRKEGHTRLAELVDRLPTEVCNDRHERVDAIYAEALAQAKSLQLPWLEVFLGHWWLQSRVLHRMDATALGEAVSLVEFAHRDETQGCPQGVCAVQDLAACYGFVDGPGFAPERLDVSREALGRIDPSWPCFTCISSEHASAMRDQGDIEASLQFVDRQVARLVERGERDAIYDFPRDRVESLVALGRLEEALAFVDECERRGRKDAHHRLSRRLDRARILARLGRTSEALAQLPAVDEIEPTPPFYWLWADAASELATRGALPNDAQLGRVLHRFIERLARQGVGRATLELAEMHGTLALRRGAPHVARRALDAMERALGVLHRPLDALDRVGKMRALIASTDEASAPVVEDAAAVLTRVREGEGRDPEGDLLLLEAAHARFPEHVPIVLAYAGCAHAMGLTEEARVILSAFHARTADEDVLLRLADLSIGRDRAEVERLAEVHRARAADDGSRAIADWILARDAHARGSHREALLHLESVLAARPGAINARLLFAESARRLGDLKAALGKLDEVVERLDEAGPHDWDRMLVATLLGDYATVRHSARRLGFEIAGEGPIDESWGVCRIRFDDEPGAPRDVWAARTGPVTARILEIARPPRTQHYGDVVAFDASPLNPPPAEGEDRKKHVWVYPLVATVREGGFRAFEIDGAHPGKAAWGAIDAAVATLGCELQISSGDEYRVREDSLPGVFALVAVPHARALREVSDALREATRSLEHPLTWIDLAREAGDTELATEHARIIEDYEL